MPTNLSILVFVASPLDYARYRHTALFFEFDPPATQHANAKNQHTQPETQETECIKSSMMEVIGSPGFMSFFEHLARVVPVSRLPDTIPTSRLRSTVSETSILDGDGDTDWNSQNWVADALSRLVTCGYLDEGARDRGLDAMVDAVMEAEDEEVSIVAASH
ncbi:hypothetical protein N7454_010616 [Penicillium verhagenii]|nr:hypothetical protein N7454_010616 [Penicillium verhagenii]